jgi:hypothetical protein
MKPIGTMQFKKVERTARQALLLASNHDPDHEQQLKSLRLRLDIVERQLQRMCAPQYRVVLKGEAGGGAKVSK